MAGGGRLRVVVDADVDVGQVRLRLSDTGSGIAEADLAKIFDPFFSTKDKGTGLGLALVQQIVAEHGGRIDVESAPGRGTTFTLTFPARRGQGRADAAPAGEPTPETAAPADSALPNPA